MKMIVAVIQPDKLDEVREALVAADITRITIVRVTGHGQAKDVELYRGQAFLSPPIEVPVTTLPHLDRTVDLEDVSTVIAHFGAPCAN